MRLHGVVHSCTENNCAFTGLSIFYIALDTAPEIVVDDILDSRMPDSGFLLPATPGSKTRLGSKGCLLMTTRGLNNHTSKQMLLSC